MLFSLFALDKVFGFDIIKVDPSDAAPPYSFGA